MVEGLTNAEYQYIRARRFGPVRPRGYNKYTHEDKEAKLERLIQRLLRNSHQEGSCRIWDGPIANSGYGHICMRINKKPRNLSVHRVAFELFIGKIPHNYTVEHDCHRKLCIEPSHLDLMTADENHKKWYARQQKGETSGFPEHWFKPPQNFSVLEMLEATFG